MEGSLAARAETSIGSAQEELTKVMGKEVFWAAKDAFAEADLNAAQKTEALQQIFSQIHEADSTWSARQKLADNAAAIFIGEDRPFGLLVDKNGALWTTPDYLKSGAFEPIGGHMKYVADYTKWTGAQ